LFDEYNLTIKSLDGSIKVFHAFIRLLDETIRLQKPLFDKCDETINYLDGFIKVFHAFIKLLNETIRSLDGSIR
jgi:hypothetical protein